MQIILNLQKRIDILPVQHNTRSRVRSCIGRCQNMAGAQQSAVNRKLIKIPQFPPGAFLKTKTQRNEQTTYLGW